ncbi:hypothetical protein C8R45DRAFT_1024749 [Mycena sanguinolenta]|nr:hypothetical protein C8R45DRAFT_1024749 [Mycena sanguinolenta]
MSLSSSEPEGEVTPLQQYASYPFSSDQEYQNGLQSIIAGGALANDPLENVRDEILRRTRVFYFNRMTGHAISMDEAREFEHAQHKTSEDASNPALPPAASSSGDASPDTEPVVLSFAQLQALIEAGRADEIPNNKIIPDELNDEAPSISTATVRKKPWELSAETDSTSDVA